MKKTILTFFIFALSFSMFAQINTIEVFRVFDPNEPFGGFVNVRTGAGINHEVIERLYNHRIVLRDFDRQIVNEWIPVKYQDLLQFYNFNKGYIHQSRLVPVSFEFSITLPNPERIDVQKRERVQQAVNDIRTMELRNDTLGYFPESRYNPCVFVEILGYDEMGRLRRFFTHNGCFDGSAEWRLKTAYYNEKGELIYFISFFGAHSDLQRVVYWIDKGYIVDFFFEYSWFLDAEEEYPSCSVFSTSDDHIGREWSEGALYFTGIQDFARAQTILEILHCEDCRKHWRGWGVVDWE